MPKLHDGRHFEDLGMITSLLSKKPMAKTPQKPLIEVLPGSQLNSLMDNGRFHYGG